MELCVLSVVIEFSLLPICEFCIQDAPLGGWFIVTPNVQGKGLAGSGRSPL